MNDSRKKTKLTYADSGVDIKAGEAAVQRIKKLAASTFNDQVLSDIGAAASGHSHAITDLSDVAAKSGTGTTVLFQASPTISARTWIPSAGAASTCWP